MGFISDHERIRLEAKRRIDAGEVTGTELGDKIGLEQSTISNFLTKRRRLSYESADALREVLGITDEFLRDPSPSVPGAPEEFVPVVSHAHAMAKPLIYPNLVARPSGVTIASLIKLSSAPATLTRQQWTRFVAIDVSSEQADFMEPLLPKGAVVVIDRHYQRFARSRRDPLSLFAINNHERLELGYPEQYGESLVLAAHMPQIPGRPVVIAPHQRIAQLIIGRICSIPLLISK